MTAQHTPGPWRTGGWGMSIGNNLAVIAETPEGAATCIARTFSPLGGTATDAEANARLIAAAPLMLEALRLLLDEAVVYAIERHVLYGRDEPELDAAIAAGKAAIRAATGEDA